MSYTISSSWRYIEHIVVVFSGLFCSTFPTCFDHPAVSIVSITRNHNILPNNHLWEELPENLGQRGVEAERHFLPPVSRSKTSPPPLR